MSPLKCRLECLGREDLSVGTMELAQYLIGKMVPLAGDATSSA